MARLSPKHPGFRTRDDVVRDVAYVLNAPLTYGTKLAVINNAAWVWTEFDGKYTGCPYWSALAIAAHSVDRKVKLRHEHVVPREVVRRMLFDLKQATEDQVRDICQRFLIGVVVTLAEDALLNAEFSKTMPPEFFDPSHASDHDPWLRYKRLPMIDLVRVCESGPPT
jgi:hypothetical protein